MSSLLRCTDDLLQQRAIQSSHYERLERQLQDRERRRRATALTLKQRIADVQCRGNDLRDLRNESRQLSEQLSQHALQLAALQCRQGEAAAAQRTAVEQLQDGVRSWSGHPARIALLIQALQAQKKLRMSAKKLLRVLTAIGTSLHLHRHLVTLHKRCHEVLQWHARQLSTLDVRLQERMQKLEVQRAAAFSEAEAVREHRLHTLMPARCEAEQASLFLEAQQSALAIYAASVEQRCAVAGTVVVTLSCHIDSEAVQLTALEGSLESANVRASQSAEQLAAQRKAEAEKASSTAESAHKAAAQLSRICEEKGTAEEQICDCRTALTESQKRTHLLLHRLMAAKCVAVLCTRVRTECERQRAAQEKERGLAEEELVQLRAQRDELVRAREMAQLAATQQAECECLCRREAQLRKAVTDMEDDEWRLLYAQLVREACRARAAAAELAAAAPQKARGLPRKRVRNHPEPAAQSSAATTAASRRQRVAVEAVVDALTLTASQTSQGRLLARTVPSVGERLIRPAPSAAASATQGLLPSTAVLMKAASQTRSAGRRLVSLKPSVAKEKPHGDCPAVSARGQTKRVRSSAAAAAGKTPFMATLSGSDSSFSLMHHSSSGDDVPAPPPPAVVNAVTSIGADAAATLRRSDSAVQLSSVSSPRSPSPRRPAAQPRHPASSGAHANEKNKTTVPFTAALPRHHHPQPQQLISAQNASPLTERMAAAAALPRTALDAALRAARHPGVVSHEDRFPATGSTGSPRVGQAGAVSAQGLYGRPLPLRGPGAAGGTRRRAPLHMPTSAEAADDLFADLFA